MDKEPSDSASEHGLHEYVDAEFTVEGLESPSREQTLHETLENLSGVAQLSILHGKVLVNYDPVLLSGEKLEETIRSAGFRISEERSAASSPLTDAFTDEGETSPNG